ncbi:MAG: glutamate mutase L, partial [Chloroflexota bacterium]
LDVEPTREAIRDIFLRRITHAKGLDRAHDIVGDVIMPTPLAVLKGATLLAGGPGGEEGLGEMMVVDVGGATTDVYSLSEGNPSRADVVRKGLPEPYAKRTVEGDLGIRFNAASILELVGCGALRERMAGTCAVAASEEAITGKVAQLCRDVASVPQSEEDHGLDTALAQAAVDIATRRHAGSIEEVYSPFGKYYFQYGKDLTTVSCVVGTGGIFAYGQSPREVLKSACYSAQRPDSLRPAAPRFFIDERYILFAVGLLAEISPGAALRVMKKNLKEVSVRN